jgi:hypothetical protein
MVQPDAQPLEDQRPPLPVIPLDRGYRWTMLAAAILAAGGTAAAWLSWSGYPAYRAGLHNRPDPSVTYALYGMMIWFACLLAQIGMIRFLARRDARPGDRGTAILLLVTSVAFTVGFMFVRELPGDAYRRGMADWSKANANIRAIRGWQAIQPVSAVATPIAPAAWPSPIAALKPVAVELAPGGAGVRLSWGSASTGDMRELFIATSATVAPPASRFWVTATPGVYVAQIQRP